ncbi:MAG: hypothetical protein KA774_18265, partial [Burkholderiaceae bacterium]|nr:hypothetical protein [Burkholderiaceae bacterium]
MHTALPTPATAAPPALAAWVAAGGGWQLRLAGTWGAAPVAWPDLPGGLGPHTPVGFDATALQAWDGGLPARLWALCTALRQQGVPVALDGLPPGLRDALQLARSGAAAPPVDARPR